MKDVITLSFNTVELISIALPVLLLVVYVWLRARDCKLNEERGFPKKAYNDLGVTTIDAIKNFSISAKPAREFVEACATDEEIDRILDPVFDKVYKASIKGDSEVYIHGRDWYYRDNIKYKEAGERLEGLGYSIRRGGKTLGVVINW